MIELLMFCGIGLLGGVLLMLLFVPLVHGRAVRLTERRLAETTPLTITEMQADKDALRAQFAMSVRRLELSMEELRAKSADRRGEIGKNAAEIEPSLRRARQEDGADLCAACAGRSAKKCHQEDREDFPVSLHALEAPAAAKAGCTGATSAVGSGPAGPSELAAAAALNVKRRQAVSRSY